MGSLVQFAFAGERISRAVKAEQPMDPTVQPLWISSKLTADPKLPPRQGHAYRQLRGGAHIGLSHYVITSYSIHYTKLYEDTTDSPVRWPDR